MFFLKINEREGDAYFFLVEKNQRFEAKHKLNTDEIVNLKNQKCEMGLQSNIYPPI